MMTNDGARQASVRATTGTALTYNGDWDALFDQGGIAPGAWDCRLLAWINQQLASTYHDLPGAMQAYAISQGYVNWSDMGSFTPGGGPPPFTDGFLLENGVDLILLEDGVSFLQQET